jgi:hypothetical protein
MNTLDLLLNSWKENKIKKRGGWFLGMWCIIRLRLLVMEVCKV